MKLKRFTGNPIIAPDPNHDWESFVTANPGAWYDEEDKEVKLLYRASGDNDEFKVHFGFATSKDGYNFQRNDLPVFSPSVDGFDAGAVEDPRIVKIGEYYYITYASRIYPPGRYWLNDNVPYTPEGLPDEFPEYARMAKTITGLAVTKDFKTFQRMGRITNTRVDNRDVILFPEKINGKFWMMHRPMTLIGYEYGIEYPAIWIDSSDDLMSWTNGQILAKPKFGWERKIGGNTPPIRTEHGWLTIYHGVGKDTAYRLGAMLLDLNDPTIVTHRTKDWLMEPEADYELDGCYKGAGVVFPCGNVVIGDTFFVYYGGADKYVGVATCPLKELINYVLSCPE